MLILPRWVSSGLLLFHPVLCVYKISSHHNTFTSVVAHSSFQARNSPINYLFLCNLSTFWKILTLSPPQRKNVRCGWKLWNCYYRFILSKYDLFFLNITLFCRKPNTHKKICQLFGANLNYSRIGDIPSHQYAEWLRYLWASVVFLSFSFVVSCTERTFLFHCLMLPLLESLHVTLQADQRFDSVSPNLTNVTI